MNKNRSYFPYLVALLLSVSGMLMSLAAREQVETYTHRASCTAQRCGDAPTISNVPDVFDWWGESLTWRMRHVPWLVSAGERTMMQQQKALGAMLSDLWGAEARYIGQALVSNK